MCGENLGEKLLPVVTAGSSPRVRGKLHAHARKRPHRGLIPACAGKTSSASPRPGAHAAHPRVCGENSQSGRPTKASPGSSPRVRGKRHPRGRHPRRDGLIPACAGKTSAASSTGQPPWAHPRVCGENVWTAVQMPIAAGSSPRVRGKLHPRAGHARRSGLIPACAGKTVLLRPNRSGSGAHPRVCGENAGDEGAGALPGGSSPRVRGKLGAGLRLIWRLRLIPACAGKT